MKIAVLGYSGSGKSTLAGRLGEYFQVPVLHLDAVNFLPHWQERDEEEGRAMVRAFMERDGWVIDGNYRRFLQAERLAAADWIIFMDFPRRVCFYRAFRRYLTFRGRVRDSIAEGCEEKFDWTFAKWILVDGRKRRVRENYRAICEKYGEKTTVCRSSRDVGRLWKTLEDAR
ncbi:DNA topology modulation protein [Gehongia tenuis]|uniref:DNA topology modulation protein n=1 Tax=Gehongia tenuis TaxID=2763655 RepID=A0A926HPI9_9FIRM|nr:DNA topology modulation protein [Gehongia tenuis]MBC8530750.1 DNA topology modulation protein [Gehongia tenuis]